MFSGETKIRALKWSSVSIAGNIQGQWVRSQSGYGKRFSSTSVRLGDNGGENAKTTRQSLWGRTSF